MSILPAGWGPKLGQKNKNERMKTIAMIPARYASTRFHAKLMQLLGDKPVIRHTYDATVATALFDEVAVITDSQIIFDEIVSNGGVDIFGDVLGPETF